MFTKYCFELHQMCLFLFQYWFLLLKTKGLSTKRDGFFLAIDVLSGEPFWKMALGLEERKGFPDLTLYWPIGKTFGLRFCGGCVDMQLVKIRRSDELSKFPPSAQQHLKVSCFMKKQLLVLAWSYSTTCSFQTVLLCQWL